jgi:hypothetical protein
MSCRGTIDIRHTGDAGQVNVGGVFIIFFMSTSTGLGRFFASGLVINICPDQHRLSQLMRQEYSTGFLQDNEFDIGVRVIFEHHGRARDFGRHRSGINLGPARVFWDPQKHHAVFQIEISGATRQS